MHIAKKGICTYLKKVSQGSSKSIASPFLIAKQVLECTGPLGVEKQKQKE